MERPALPHDLTVGLLLDAVGITVLALHKEDALVPVVKEMLQCRACSAALIARHIRDACKLARAVDKDQRQTRRSVLVELRDCRLRIRTDDDNARNIACDKIPHTLLLACRIVLRTREEQRVRALPQMLLDAVEHLGKEHIVKTRYDDADARRTLRVQLACLQIRQILQFLDGVLHLEPRLFTHGIVPVHDARNRRHRHPRLLRHINDRRFHSLFPLYHCHAILLSKP